MIAHGSFNLMLEIQYTTNANEQMIEHLVKQPLRKPGPSNERSARTLDHFLVDISGVELSH